jgi:molybdate transport system ATP-binding protein
MIRLTFAALLKQGDFSLDLQDDATVEVLGVFGPSGSGKTSLLEVIAGLRTPERGLVRVADHTLLDTGAGVNVPAHYREVGYVPQDVALFPHLDVRRNLLYGTRKPAAGNRQPADVRREKAEGKRRDESGSPESATGRRQATDDAGLNDADSRQPTADARHDLEHVCDTLEIAHLIERSVRDLSGGERQRVAIGRALMSAPRILLLDEPLTAVDRGRKDRILPYLLRIRRDLHVPMIYVTHDAREMREIADRVLRLDGGRVVDAGAPAEVLGRGGKDKAEG